MSWALTNPWLLAGLAALGLPILIHYLTRPRPRRIALPTIGFLIEAGSGRQAIHRLRTWLILALRALAIAAIVLWFCRPVQRQPVAGEGEAQAPRVVLLVDASLSMQAAVGGVTCFDRARAQAADVLRRLPDETEASVILFGREPRPVLPALTPNRPALHEALLAATPTCESAQPAAAIALAAELLAGRGDLYVFSDFQRDNWGGVDLAALRGVQVHLHPAVEQPVPNLGITEVQVQPAIPIVGEPVTVLARVLNATPESRQTTVSLALGGFAQQVELALPPYASRLASFNLQLPAPGWFAGAVSLAADNLAADNTRYLAVRVGEALDVLMLSDADPGDWRTAAWFVETALQPGGDGADSLRVNRRRGDDAERSLLETAEIVVAVPPLTLGAETARLLADRIGRGAGLLCFLDGDQAPALLATLSEASSGALSPPFALAGRVDDASAEGGAVALANLGTSPLRLFADPAHGDLGGLRFRRHFQTRDDQEQRVFLRHADGAAALTIAEAGRGRVVYANLPIALDASNLTGSPLFPALVHELLRALRRADPAAASAEPGALLELHVEGEADATVTGSTGATLAGTVVGRGRTTLLALPAQAQPGHVRATRGDRLVGLTAINPAPGESDTRMLPFTALQSPDGPALTVASDRFVLPRTERPWWPTLAGIAVACLLAEMLLLALWRRPGGRRGGGR